MIDVVVSGVLFDMDGTLVDSTAVVEDAWSRFGAEHGIDPAEILGFSTAARRSTPSSASCRTWPRTSSGPSSRR